MFTFFALEAGGPGALPRAMAAGSFVGWLAGRARAKWPWRDSLPSWPGRRVVDRGGHGGRVADLARPSLMM